MSNTRKDFSKSSSNVKQFPSSKPALSSTKFWKPTFPLPILPCPDIPMGGRLARFMEQWGELTLYRPGRFQDPIQFTSPTVYSSDSSKSVFLPIIKRRNWNGTSPEMGSRKSTWSGNSGLLLPAISCTQKERKFTYRHRSLHLKSIYMTTTFQDGNNQVSLSINIGQWLGCLWSGGCLSTCSNSSPIKFLHFVFSNQILQFRALRFGISLRIFTKLMDIVAAHLCQRAISPFPYLDDWLIRDLIRTRLISHTIYCPQTMQSQGFIPNLKKSDLNPAQQFTFIGMEFLTQHNTVRLQLDCIESILLTVKQFLTDSSFGLSIPFSFGETQCCSRLSTSRQVPFMSASDVPAVSLETSCSSFGSSNFDLEYDP